MTIPLSTFMILLTVAYDVIIEIFLRKNGNDSDEDEEENDILARVERVQEMLRDRLSENMGDPGRISFDIDYRENLWIW
ncbi:hypothetical protein ONZ45_g12601 [Pleurotus djamor]|nr:hypothetical protein ONZ45_g12601 [Pleurotus djamor]